MSAAAFPPLSRLQIFLLNLVWRATTHVVTSPFDRLKWVYRFHSAYDWLASIFSANEKSRSRDCCAQIYISTLEAAYITKHTGIPFNTSSPHSPEHKSPCPFHSPGKSCAIYQFRPFSCRTAHSQQFSNGASGLGYPSFVPAKIGHVIDELNNGNPKKDIRDFF